MVAFPQKLVVLETARTPCAFTLSFCGKVMFIQKAIVKFVAFPKSFAFTYCTKPFDVEPCIASPETPCATPMDGSGKKDGYPEMLSSKRMLICLSSSEVESKGT